MSNVNLFRFAYFLLISIVLCGSMLGGCSTPQKSPIGSNSKMRANEQKSNIASIPIQVSSKPPTCQPFLIENFRVPSLTIRGDASFFITRLTKPCVSQDGVRGFLSDSDWTAMGIPCTGGKGEITLSGTNYKPLKVAFSLATACPTLPQSMEYVEKLGQNLGFSSSTKLISFNPMAVQYWEILKTADQDVGDRLELRSDPKLLEFWADFRANKLNLPVKIYGRENAWVQDNAVYEIQGELKFEIPMSFRLIVKSGRVLRDDEVTALHSRCEAIKPSRNCADF